MMNLFLVILCFHFIYFYIFSLCNPSLFEREEKMGKRGRVDSTKRGRKTLAVAASRRRQSFIRSGGRKIPPKEEAKNGIKWILARDNR